jgi:hypothetical protein
MFQSPGFRAAQPAIWSAPSNRRRLPARIEIVALPFASANGIGGCLANGPPHIFHTSSANYTPCDFIDEGFPVRNAPVEALGQRDAEFGTGRAYQATKAGFHGNMALLMKDATAKTN